MLTLSPCSAILVRPKQTERLHNVLTCAPQVCPFTELRAPSPDQEPRLSSLPPSRANSRSASCLISHLKTSRSLSRSTSRTNSPSSTRRTPSRSRCCRAASRGSRRSTTGISVPAPRLLRLCTARHRPTHARVDPSRELSLSVLGHKARADLQLAASRSRSPTRSTPMSCSSPWDEATTALTRSTRNSTDPTLSKAASCSASTSPKCPTWPALE